MQNIQQPNMKKKFKKKERPLWEIKLLKVKKITLTPKNKKLTKKLKTLKYIYIYPNPEPTYNST